jgi:hypothetical protein
MGGNDQYQEDKGYSAIGTDHPFSLCHVSVPVEHCRRGVDVFDTRLRARASDTQGQGAADGGELRQAAGAAASLVEGQNLTG